MLDILAGVGYLHYVRQNTQINAQINCISLCCNFSNLICAGFSVVEAAFALSQKDIPRFLRHVFL